MGVRGEDGERESKKGKEIERKIREHSNNGATIKLEQLGHVQKECECFIRKEKRKLKGEF